MSHLLYIHALTKTFPGCDRPVIEDVGFAVDPGQVLAIVGPSGCGKTTALRAITGFERVDQGIVRREDRVCADAARGIHLPPEKRGIGIVFQDYALFPHLSVIQNAMFGVRAQSRRRRKQIAREALWMVGLLDLDNRPVQDLSGGQQQRVAIARALAPGAKVVLLDEPFSNLDADLRRATRDEVRLLAQRAGLAVVLVTHDQEEALSTADRIAVMNRGRFIQSGRPEAVYAHPRTAFVAGFLGQTNLVPATTTGTDVADTALGKVQINRTHDGPALLSVRPEHLALAPVPADAAASHRPVGRITAREFKGHDLTYHVRVGPGTYVVQMGAGAAFQTGHDVQVIPTIPAAIVVDDRGEAGPEDERA